MAAGHIVGGELLIVHSGRIVLHEAVGFNDKVDSLPMERNSIFRIRSMTKPFIGAAILLLEKDELLTLDDRVGGYLSSWDNERTRDITIRQLLTQTSGFERGRFEGFPDNPREYPSLRVAVDAAGEKGPQHEPGEWYRYAGVNTAALGAIVEQVSAISLEQFLEANIFEPLELRDTHTRFSPDVEWASRMNSTNIYVPDSLRFFRYWDPSREQRYPYFRAMGGMYTTTLDYAKWLDVWMNGWRSGSEHFLSKGMIREALSPGSEDSYGFQWALPMVEEPLVFGHTGSDGTYAWAMPELDAMVLLFTQSRRGRGLREVTHAWFQLVTGEPYKARPPTVALPDPRVHIDRVALAESQRALYIGTYGSGRGELQVWEESSQLRASLEPLGDPFELIPVGDHVFAMGRFAGGEVVEVYYPLFRIRFALEAGKAARYELFDSERGGVELRGNRAS